MRRPGEWEGKKGGEGGARGPGASTAAGAHTPHAQQVEHRVLHAQQHPRVAAAVAPGHQRALGARHKGALRARQHRARTAARGAKVPAAARAVARPAPAAALRQRAAAGAALAQVAQPHVAVPPAVPLAAGAAQVKGLRIGLQQRRRKRGAAQLHSGVRDRVRAGGVEGAQKRLLRLLVLGVGGAAAAAAAAATTTTHHTLFQDEYLVGGGACSHLPRAKKRFFCPI